MGFLDRLRDRFIVDPVAKRITDSIVSKPPNIFSVPVGFNNSMASYNKRVTSNSVDWQVLRSLSINHETTRAAINVRKRQITQLGYDVVDNDDDTDPQSTAQKREQVRKLISNIGGTQMRFRSLLDRMIEDTLVLDACVFYKQRDRAGRLLRIIPIDGATIKLRVDQGGARPLPPEIAFEQWIKGAKVTELTTDEMTYEMMNPRNDSPYGLSPIESLLITLDMSMRGMLYNLNYLSDNNIPQGFLGMPEGWTPDQIKEYKEFFDAMVGSSKAQAKVYPIPAGTTYQATSKPGDFSFQQMFDYLDRKIVMLFDVTPQELGLSLQQYKENAEGQDRIQSRKGIKPLVNFLEEIFTDIIQLEFGFSEFAFKFTGLDSKYTPEEVKVYIPLGVLSIDEVRNDKGLSKIGVGNFVLAGNQMLPVGTANTTVSGTGENEDFDEQNPTTEITTPSVDVITPNGNDMKELAELPDLKKKARNLSFERVAKDPKFKKFKKSIQKSLLNAIKPYSNVSEIDKITGVSKVDMEDFDINIEIPGLTGFLKWAGQEGTQNAADLLKIKNTFNMRSDPFRQMIADRENYLIDSVNKTTKDWIVGKIAEGKDQALTNAEIADNIAEESEDISASRADTIVNTEVANAMQQAELGVYKDQGIEEKTWVTSEDDLVDPICSDLDGEIVKVDEDFSTGDDAPPAHPNCRCYIQAVTDAIESVDKPDLTKDWVTINGAHVLLGGSGGESSNAGSQNHTTINTVKKPPTNGKSIAQLQEESQRASGRAFLANYDDAVNSKDWEGAANIIDQVMNAPKDSPMGQYAGSLVSHFHQYVAPILEESSAARIEELSRQVPLLSRAVFSEKK